MIATIFRNNDRVTFFVTPFFVLGIWFFSFFILNNTHIAPEGGVLYPILQEWVSSFAVLLGLNLLINLISAFLISYLCISQEVTNKQNYFATFFLILFNTYLNIESPLHPLLIANMFLLISLYSYFNTYRSDNAMAGIFDGAFFLSLASLFYYPMLFFIPLIFIALIVMRTFYYREWLLIILGLLLPYFICAIFFFLFDVPQTLFLARFQGSFSGFSFPLLTAGSFLINLAFIILVIVVFLYLLSNGLGGKVKTQKSKTIILIALFIGFFSSFFLHEHPTFAPILVLIPFSMLAGDVIGSLKKKAWVNFLSILFMVLLIISNLQAVGMLQY